MPHTKRGSGLAYRSKNGTGHSKEKAKCEIVSGKSSGGWAPSTAAAKKKMMMTGEDMTALADNATIEYRDINHSTSTNLQRTPGENENNMASARACSSSPTINYTNDTDSTLPKLSSYVTPSPSAYK